MKYFGTDGIRRQADFFSETFLKSFAAGVVKYGREKFGDNVKILLGGDTRESTKQILHDLTNILVGLGVECGTVGVLPTPAINYCLVALNFDLAIDVTASHNPYTDNGLKVFERRGAIGVKIATKGRQTIEETLEGGLVIAPSTKKTKECRELHEEAVKCYKKHLVDYIGESDLSGLKIGVDCANGATSVIGGSTLEELGAKVILINTNPSYGTGINASCGSTHLDSLRDLVLGKNLDFGVAFDGDGDRSLFIDSTGEIVDGDQVIAVVAEDRKIKQAVVTVMANQGLFDWARKAEVELIVTAVGDTNVTQKMHKNNITLGGEQSGHTILPNSTSGDGLLTAMEIARIVKRSGRSLKELAQVMTKMPQVIVNMPATTKMKARFQAGLAKDLIENFSRKITKNGGRILIRPSGTENLIRVTIWGKNEEDIQDAAANIANELSIKLKEEHDKNQASH